MDARTSVESGSIGELDFESNVVQNIKPSFKTPILGGTIAE